MSKLILFILLTGMANAACNPNDLVELKPRTAKRTYRALDGGKPTCPKDTKESPLYFSRSCERYYTACRVTEETTTEANRNKGVRTWVTTDAIGFLWDSTNGRRL